MHFGDKFLSTVHLDDRDGFVILGIPDPYVAPRYQRSTHPNIHLLIMNRQLVMKFWETCSCRQLQARNYVFVTLAVMEVNMQTF